MTKVAYVSRTDDSQSYLYIAYGFMQIFMSLGGYYDVVVAYHQNNKDGLFGILQFTENDDNFFKRFVFESISNLVEHFLIKLVNFSKNLLIIYGSAMINQAMALNCNWEFSQPRKSSAYFSHPSI